MDSDGIVKLQIQLVWNFPTSEDPHLHSKLIRFLIVEAKGPRYFEFLFCYLSAASIITDTACTDYKFPLDTQILAQILSSTNYGITVVLNMLKKILYIWSLS